jgi:hypothetical protein
LHIYICTILIKIDDLSSVSHDKDQ